jgi:hypothetical protein
MALPANIRVNLAVPFPAMVQGGGGIGVTKVNGVWTISLIAGQLVSVMNAAGFLPSFSGTGLLDFGAFPGSTDAQLVITGQAAIVAGSVVEAFLLPAVTADHSIDDHWIDSPSIMAGNIVPGIGFTIYGVCPTEIGGVDGVNPALGPGSISGAAGMPRLFGKYNVGWRWQ